MADANKSVDELKSELLQKVRDLKAAEAAKRRDNAIHTDTIKDIKADINEIVDEIDVLQSAD